MQAGNVQYAPKGKQNGPKKTQKRQEQPKGVKEKLYDMPRAAGIALMVLMIALSLPVGNFRALESAKPKAFLSRRDVASIVQDRIAEAGNAVKVASRGQVAAQLLDDITAASDAMAVAKNAREISRADQKLTAAVSNLADLAADLADRLTAVAASAADTPAVAEADAGSAVRPMAAASVAGIPAGAAADANSDTGFGVGRKSVPDAVLLACGTILRYNLF